MNKKLIAVALSAAFVAPAAFADVTLYGFVAAGVEYASATGATGGSALDAKGTVRVANQNSRIGFKGQEDLGNGLKAVWQVESAVAVDGGTPTAANGAPAGTGFATRNSFIGLNGGFGEVRFGRHDDAYYVGLLNAGLDLMINTTAENSLGANTVFGRAAARRNNTALYMTPNFGGFSAVATYSADEVRSPVPGTTSRANRSVYAVSGTYAANGLTAVLGYSHAGDSTGPTFGTAATVEGSNAWTAALGYKFADTMIGAGYEHISYGANLTTNSYSQNAWTIAASQQIGALGLKLSYASLGGGRNDDLLYTSSDYKANQWVLGATYDLSKRTQVQAYATRITNKAAQQANFEINPLTVNAGADPQAYGVALKHSF